MDFHIILMLGLKHKKISLFIININIFKKHNLLTLYDNKFFNSFYLTNSSNFINLLIIIYMVFRYSLQIIFFIIIKF